MICMEQNNNEKNQECIMCSWKNKKTLTFVLYCFFVLLSLQHPDSLYFLPFYMIQTHDICFFLLLL